MISKGGLNDAEPLAANPPAARVPISSSQIHPLVASITGCHWLLSAHSTAAADCASLDSNPAAATPASQPPSGQTASSRSSSRIASPRCRSRQLCSHQLVPAPHRATRVRHRCDRARRPPPPRRPPVPRPLRSVAAAICRRVRSACTVLLLAWPACPH